jgi:pyrroline-5-carboxylate reductase
MAQAIQGKLVISVLAGVRLQQLSDWLPSGTPIIRAMPNTPCQIREGMTILSCNSDQVASHLQTFTKVIFSTLGRCRFLDEKHMVCRIYKMSFCG